MSAQTLNQQQGSVVGVNHDMILVRYNSKGVLFRGSLLKNRSYKLDDIVQFNARRASAVDIEVAGTLAKSSGYEIYWVGTEIKFIKSGRTLNGEGVVLAIPDSGAQYMFVDWKFTANPPQLSNKCTNINVFVTRASIRPEIEKLTEMFKVGQRVKYVAREQAPNEKGVCWRSAIATDENHDIQIGTQINGNRPLYSVVPKNSRPTGPSRNQPAKPSSSGIVQRPLKAPPTRAPEPVTPAPPAPAPAPTNIHTVRGIQKPPPVDGFDYFDTSKEACAARFKHFATKYREENPTCLYAQRAFEGMLKIKYLNQLTEQLAAIRAAQD